MILKYCADEDTFQNVLNEFLKKGGMAVIEPFLHLSADKDTVEKKEEKRKGIHHCCICLGEIRSAQKGMSTLGVSIVLLLYHIFTFFFYHFLNDNTSHMVTCFIFSTFAFVGKVALGSANHFNNNKNKKKNNSILVI